MRLAREAGILGETEVACWTTNAKTHAAIRRFASLVAAECANICIADASDMREVVRACANKEAAPMFIREAEWKAACADDLAAKIKALFS